MEQREEIFEKDFSFKKHAWRQFKKNKPAVISLYMLFFLLFLFVFADFIANDQPLYAKYKGETYYPALTSIFNSTKTDTLFQDDGGYEVLQFDITDWKQLKLESVVWAPIAYSPDKPDRYNRDFVSPFQKQRYKNPEGEIVKLPAHLRHYLGTDQIGKDLAAGLIHGTRVSLTVGLVSVGIAALIGILLGALAGYYGDRGMKTYRARFYLLILGLITGFFYAFIVRAYSLEEAFNTSISAGVFQFLWSFIIMVFFTSLFSLIGKPFKKVPFLNAEVAVPIDGIVSRVIEILNSMPRLILIISIAAIFKEKNLFLVMAVIGLTTWTGIARFTRAEFLRTRNLEYIQAARALGLREWRTILKHALPNSIAPVFVAIAFGIASAILIESGLSFLGIGVPDDQVTWGSLLNSGRQRFDAWWMVVFPGIAIFITVTIYNLIGEALRDATDPRLKS